MVNSHAECFGENNSQAKQWKITSPEGDVFIIKGTLKGFCTQNGLSYGKMKRSVNLGKITDARLPSTSNTLHWEIQSYEYFCYGGLSR